MDFDEYGPWAKRVVDWTLDYHRTIRERKVRAPLTPGAVAGQLPESPPELAEPMETIFADFERIVPDGMTHWQHPRFMAYFPSNAAPASMLAEQLVNGIAANCLLWQTSPAGTEIETRMIDWLRQALGLPAGWRGLIQDAASTATLCAALTMRERSMGWRGIRSGVSGETAPRIYASAQTHSSVDKACWVAGIGQDNLVKIGTDENFAMRPDALREAIEADRAAGLAPAGVMICVGGTSIGAIDPVSAVMDVAEEEGLYTHVDAAWAGSAMICPEFRSLWDGVERADSVVFNPHKWLGAHFDCSVQFLKDPTDQIRTLGLRPSFLETGGVDDAVNYSEWTLPLGRRFRALKLWFLIRAYGLEGLRARIRDHVAWTEEAEARIAGMNGLKIVTRRRLALFTFAHVDGDARTRALLETVNDDGRTYLTQTSHEGRYLIRLTMGQFDMKRADMVEALDAIEEINAALG
ncbi:aspartate aminotransferase family protein [Pikeienuella piscinae]|uniref:Aspartate aminotransferase family protein n=1 Tax=Pikeienuella piscinae TaxID=2748098 RepID=A0A7L5BWS0_9RHOB|nr:pyridoxal-dependent decarboxylase [Pikeienuella piscinae]QIE54324.1 aspartate aminotransferase family protein [Pikeienuella piscinae]